MPNEETSVASIKIYDSGPHEDRDYSAIGITSCHLLVRLCFDDIPAGTASLPVQALRSSPTDDWVYLAEVIFYSSEGHCPPNGVIPTPPSTTITTITIGPPITSNAQSAVCRPVCINKQWVLQRLVLKK